MRTPVIAAPRSLTATAKTAVFVLNVLPTRPSRPIDEITPTPLVMQVAYPNVHGPVMGDLSRPPTDRPHSGIMVCLGVVSFGVDKPQVPRLGDVLARSGLAVLLSWSPAGRDRRLDPDDGASIALAYQWLIEQPGVDPTTSGLLETGVGGAFVLMAAANPLIRDRASFVAAFLLRIDGNVGPKYHKLRTVRSPYARALDGRSQASTVDVRPVIALQVLSCAHSRATLRPTAR